MEIIVSIILVAGALLAIASGIWVAFALGSAISINRKKKDSRIRKPFRG